MGPGAKKPFYRRLRYWLLAALVVVVVGSVTGVEMTSRSSFCKSCHIMEPFYESWLDDPHRDVQCVECHIAPGMENFVAAKLNGLGQVVDDMLSRTSTKPSASVSVFACTRSGCHVIDEINTDNGGDRPYFFNHRKHLDIEYKGIAIKCTTCHSHFKGDRHFEVNTNTCVTCHLAPAVAGGHAPRVLAADSTHGPAETVAPANCENCHAAPDKPIQHNGLTIDHGEYVRFGASCDACHRGTTAEPMPVGDTQCLSCHVFGMERAGDVETMHRVHTEGEHKVECFNCHGVTPHGPDAEAMSLETFDCRSCHAGQHDVQRSAYTFANGHAARPAGDTPVSPMFLVHVDCTGCHVARSAVRPDLDNGATVARASAEACDACHRAGLGAQMIPLWQRTTRQLYDEVVAMLPTADDPWADASPEAAAQVDAARRLLDLIRIDGSWGVHNPQYTEQLIEQARAGVLAARAAVAGGQDAPP